VAGLGLLALLLAGLVSVATAATPAFRAKVVGVTDGDTITVLRAGRPEKIRLHGIDSPERGQPFGARAKQFTARLASDQEVTVRVTDRDRYGRTVADVFLPDGRNLNQEIVRAGYAWWTPRYSRDPVLAALEAAARKARVGLWADPHPQAPWDWKRAQRLAAQPSD
jgi:endonuclease YncB( thermonuclease family)